MADSNILNEILSQVRRDQSTQNPQATRAEMKGLASEMQKSLTAALKEGLPRLGIELAKQANIPVRQLAGGEAMNLGREFAPVLQKWFTEFDEVGRSTKKLRDKFDELGGILDNVRKKHEKELTTRQQAGEAQAGGAGFGQGLIGMLGSAARGDVRGFLGAAGMAVGGMKSLGELAMGMGAAGVANTGWKMGLWGAAAAGVAETALLGMGVSRLQQAWPEASRNARAASRARMAMGLGVGGSDVVAPFVDQAGLFATDTGAIANNITSFMGAGGSGMAGGRNLQGMMKISDAMERMALRFGVSGTEMSQAAGELNRWALQTPEGLYKSIDKAYATAQKTGQTEMFPEMLRAVASTVGYINPRTLGPMGGNTDQVTNILGELARYGYRGAAGSQVYGQIAGAVSGMMFDPVKAAFGYGMLGLNMQQMVNPNAPGTIAQVLAGVQGDKFKALGPLYGPIALRMAGFGDMSPFALNRMAAGQQVAWEKAMGPDGKITQESLSKLAEGMLSEQFFTTDQALTRTKIDEQTKALSTGGTNVMNALNQANRFLLMMTLGQFAGKDNMFEQIGKMLGLDKLGVEQMKQTMTGDMLGEYDRAFPRARGAGRDFEVNTTVSVPIMIDGHMVGATTVSSGTEFTAGTAFNKRPGGGSLTAAKYQPPTVATPIPITGTAP